MKKELTDKEQAIKSLKEMGLKPGVKVYTIVKHVSSSGMSRHIQPYIVHKGEIISIGWYVSRALGWKLVSGTHAIKVSGCGMDMGFHMVYTLGRVMFPKGFTLPKGKRGRNGDTSGYDNDGGYALNQEWI